jgi:hypothetical protein
MTAEEYDQFTRNKRIEEQQRDYRNNIAAGFGSGGKIDINQFGVSKSGQVVFNNQCSRVLVVNSQLYSNAPEEIAYIDTSEKSLTYVKPDSRIGKLIISSGKEELIVGDEMFKLTDPPKEKSDIDKLINNINDSKFKKEKDVKKFLTPICSLAVDVFKLSTAYFKITENINKSGIFYVVENEDKKTSIKIWMSFEGSYYNIRFFIVKRKFYNFFLFKKTKQEQERVLEIKFEDDKIDYIYDFDASEKRFDEWMPNLNSLIEVLSNKIIQYYEKIKQKKENISYNDLYKYEIPNKVKDYRLAIKEITNI